VTKKPTAMLLPWSLLLVSISCSEESAKVTDPGDEDPAPCVVTVLSPNGGETWTAGLQYPISWAVSDCGTQVAIELMLGDAVATTIADSSDNDGNYIWTAQQVGGASSGYRIRITDLEGGNSDVSDGTASIAPPTDPTPCTLSVTSPNGGESWLAGFDYPISWTTDECGPAVAIELWRDGSLVAMIADSTANDGELVWTATQVANQINGYRVRIVDLEGEYADESDGTFRVMPPEDPAPCVLTLSSPNGGESWTAGTSYPITWTRSDCGQTVSIELWRAGAQVATIAGSTANDGSYTWTAAQVGGQSAGYKVRVTDLESESVDESNAVFTIAPPVGPDCGLTLTSPNGGESWVAGESHAITWNESDCGEEVALELWRAGTKALTISANTPNDGSYTWTAAQVGGQSSGYRLRVIDLTSDALDESNADFTIAAPIDPTPCELAVTVPAGGETWVEGLDYPITWETSDCGTAVSILLLRDGAAPLTIAASTDNDGSYTWAASQISGATTGYRIHVTDLESGTGADSGLFTIGDAPPNPDSYFCVSLTGTKTSGVSTTDIASFGWANSDCYRSIDVAINAMSPGDQVWINDGTYDEAIELGAAESGSANNYTIVRARNAGRVKLDGDAFAMIDLRDTSYVEVWGISVIGCGTLPVYVHEGSHHFKIRRVSWNQRTGLISTSSHHGLMEDCYAYGGPHRYAFQVNKSSHDIIFRRCLVRWDYSNITEPLACFASYTCDNIYYQNCISIDGTDYKGVDHTYDGLKSYFTPNGSTECHYVGCISLNMDGAAGWWMEGTAAQGSLTDCVAWQSMTNAGDASDTYKPYAFNSTADVGGWVLRNCTFGVNDLGARPVSFDGAIPESMHNSIIYGMILNEGEYAVSGSLDEHDYNCYWGNTGGRNKSGGVGAHSLTDVNPFANGLVSLVNVAGGILATAGDDGGPIGARIMTKIGVAGTLIDDAGWDQDTGEPLWPWPHEDQIREDCRSFVRSAGEAYTGSPAMNGARGFCAPGETLTGYIQGFLSR